MKSYQNNASTEENGPLGCIKESKLCGKSVQDISYWNKPALKADDFQAASPSWIHHGKNPLQKPESQLWLPNLLWIPGQSMTISRAASPLLSTGETPWSAVSSSGLPRTRDTWIYTLERMQRRATRTTKGLEHLSLEESLTACRGESSERSHQCL